MMIVQSTDGRIQFRREQIDESNIRSSFLLGEMEERLLRLTMDLL